MFRVVHHGVTSSFFGIGILPVLDLLGGQYFRLVLLIWRELLFSAKGGWLYQKGGQCPLFPQKGGRCPLFEGKGVPAKNMIPKRTNRDFLWYRYGKYQEIPTDTDRKIPIRYNSSYVYVFMFFSTGQVIRNTWAVGS
jgi:hypothetical protein